MTPESLAERLLRTFLAELDDQLATLNVELLALERGEGDRDARLAAVFRVAHTLKGAARAANVPAVERTCHALESALADVRAGRRTLEGPLFAALFATVDALGEAARRLRAAQPLDDAALAAVERALGGGGGVGRGMSAMPAPGAAARGAAGAEPRFAAGDAGVGRGAGAGVGYDEAGARGGPPPNDTIAPIAPASTTDRPPPSPESGGDADAPPSAPAATVRVATDKLDALVAAAGDLGITTARVARIPPLLEEQAEEAAHAATRWRQAVPRLRQALARAGASPELHEAAEEVERELRALTGALRGLALGARQDARALQRVGEEVAGGAHRLTLQPFHEITAALPRLVRDLATETGKQVELVVEGGDVEADRLVLDGVRDALLHLVRNAVDHGLETPAERTGAGKAAAGTVRVAAQLRGAELRVTVADDGRGLDVPAIRAGLARRGMQAPADDRELARVLFEGGFSTRQEATAISGRGVGLDAVKAAVERVRGTVDVRWTPGAGTTFRLTTPLSLATQRALLVRVGTQPLALPTPAVSRLLRVRADALRHAEGRRLLPTPEGPVPVASLARLLGPPLVEDPASDRVSLVLLEVAERRVALRVDEALAETELVVRPLPRRAGELPQLAGAALLPDGRVALVLNPAALVAGGLRARGEAAPAPAAAPAAAAPRLLVVDDSITTRTLEQSVLEAAGYEVLTAVDGEDGWRVLTERGADLVLSDVEMPRLDGFALCERIRASKPWAQLPVVLVTSLESAEHRARGREAGADAYVVKSSFDQEALLATVRELLGREAP